LISGSGLFVLYRLGIILPRKPSPSIPGRVTECEVRVGLAEAAEKFHKVIISEVEWNDYKNFHVKK
jgi:hypothetical protein